MTNINCEECHAACCKYASVVIDKPENDKDFDEIKWLIAHENVVVYIDQDDDWVVEFVTPCKFYDSKQNKCINYIERPLICKHHEIDECVMNGEGKVEKIVFKTWDDIENYKNLKKE
ncbi:YkgJ family cysteine cluster protein [Candidatus Woesearchaeota archaeon]|nr:YkgJ family cysteine cluster protein [Candidatus Woesearchaeota archaeon]